jgi:hypothetical protein
MVVHDFMDNSAKPHARESRKMSRPFTPSSIFSTHFARVKVVNWYDKGHDLSAGRQNKSLIDNLLTIFFFNMT